MAVFSEAMSFFKISHFFLKSHNWRTENVHCLSALALKNDDSMNKEKHSLRNFCSVTNNPGGSYTQRNSSRPQ